METLWLKKEKGREKVENYIFTIEMHLPDLPFMRNVPASFTVHC